MKQFSWEPSIQNGHSPANYSESLNFKRVFQRKDTVAKKIGNLRGGGGGVYLSLSEILGSLKRD